VTTRIARDLNGQSGPGRSTSTVEQVAQLRLEAIREGSTRLLLAAGEDTLDIDSPLEAETLDRLWQVLDGFEAGQRPAWVSQPVAEAALELATSLAVARAVEIRGARGGRMRPSVHIVPRTLKRTVWAIESPPNLQGGVVVSGLLEAVDLRSRRFRVHDDVGNDIVLDEVSNPHAAAALIGQRVSAEGNGERGVRGQLVRVHGAVVWPAPVPTEWTQSGRVQTDPWTLAAALNAPGPPPGGVPGVDDEEIEEFLASLRR
jgi:hypothetical protein